MRRTLTVAGAVLAAAAIMAAPASAAKPALKPHQLAKQECKAEKRADKQAFKAVHGKRAMRTCVKGAKPEVRALKRAAQQECREQRDTDLEGFRDEWGNNRNSKNAMGKCVSSKVRGELAADRRAFRNAAKICRDQRDEIGREAFREQWGSERSKGRNAFGKCVSTTAKEIRDAEEEPGGPYAPAA